MVEINHFVFYDIEVDRVRNRIANICLDYGLERIQFSGFAGMLGRNRREELFLKLANAIQEGSGRILVLPVCEKDFRNILEHKVENEDEKPDAPQGR